MKTFLSFLFLAITLKACTQNSVAVKNHPAAGDRKVGGNCEGCEAIYECPVPFSELNEVDTLPGFNEAGPKIQISGIIYKPDGKTPAPGVVMYIYHTDQKGIYATRENEKGWGKRHGYIRGWIKTNEKGKYTIYTVVPASYPGNNNPKHIHPTIKEPGFSEYWIDEFLFADDPLLPEYEKNKPHPVGGYGVLKTEMKNGMLRATRNIILGLNVQGYPVN
jgi:protocatechuate 3,4-dioxygenase beta subunit